jgi:hypothetical protein
LRLGAIGYGLDIPLDPYDRQDDHGCGLVGEFDNGTHQPLPLTADTDLSDPQ